MTTERNGERHTVLSLDETGSLDVSFLGRVEGAAKLDAHGCLAGKDFLMAEWAPPDKIWTSRQAFDVAGTCLLQNKEEALCIAADGAVERRLNGGAAPAEPTRMRIRGYDDDARCAGLLLLAKFTEMKKPMEIGEGPAVHVPPPESSRCGAYPRL